ncbi:MAG TPA: trehalose-6-phosphate synthase [Stellaceae bacterium]|nr:trehalose-6-phosphate synthase [Stellaceae bacterium]
MSVSETLGEARQDRFGAAPATKPGTPSAAAAAKAERRLVVVSNRVGPIAPDGTGQGGLVVALRAALEEAGGLWFGFSGAVNERPSLAPALTTAGEVTAATLDLTRRDFEEYYVGYANRVLWPLFHYRPSLIGYSRRDAAGYLRVNEIFARALLPLLRPGDLVWVHDYHLIPFAEALRRLGWADPIGFFLHTPFPAAELLRLLPDHRGIVAALCAYDLVGFQTASDLQGFRDFLLRRANGEDLGQGMLRGFGRMLRAAVFPIGIDVAGIEGLAAAAEGSRQTRRLRDSIRDRSLIIGVDRLDYSKGLAARFAAYAHLLERREIRGRTVFMQIAPPSRSDVPEYREIRRGLEAAAGSINGRYAEFDWTPLRYLNKSFNHRVLTGFYRAAQIGLVTPFRDGMNLVAKEYVASQSPENPGMLVLSCFAGAADELGEAMIVNPHDREGVAEAVMRGLDMPAGERRERWTAMMATLRRNSIDAWRKGFVAALTAAGAQR